MGLPVIFAFRDNSNFAFDHVQATDMKSTVNLSIVQGLAMKLLKGLLLLKVVLAT